MAALIVTTVVVALAIVFTGSVLSNVVSTPETRALTHLVSTHRFKGPLARAKAIGGLLSTYGLDASGTRDATRAEIAERRERLLADAKAFDQRYERYHWGVKSEDIMRDVLDAPDHD